jgi:hypothetical protein
VKARTYLHVHPIVSGVVAGAKPIPLARLATSQLRRSSSSACEGFRAKTSERTPADPRQDLPVLLGDWPAAQGESSDLPRRLQSACGLISQWWHGSFVYTGSPCVCVFVCAAYLPSRRDETRGEGCEVGHAQAKPSQGGLGTSRRLSQLQRANYEGELPGARVSSWGDWIGCGGHAVSGFSVCNR